MRRRLEREQRAGRVDKGVRLYESDYLMGVHDTFRSGALRFKRHELRLSGQPARRGRATLRQTPSS